MRPVLPCVLLNRKDFMVDKKQNKDGCLQARCTKDLQDKFEEKCREERRSHSDQLRLLVEDWLAADN